jgi:hypothetical protein
VLKLTGYAVIAAFSLTGSAQAKDWYVFDAPRDRCLSASQAVRMSGIAEVISPGSFVDLVRREGRTPTLLVTRDNAGTIIQTDVKDRGIVMSWFATEALCLAAKAILEREGSVVAPGELR